MSVPSGPVGIESDGRRSFRGKMHWLLRACCIGRVILVHLQYSPKIIRTKINRSQRLLFCFG
jgi:hypothetical protein